MYKLIKLDYELNSLYPYLNHEVLNIHYNNIYLKYLSNLNTLLEKANYQSDYSPNELIDNIDIFPLSTRGEILYNLSAFLNHNLYFYNISNANNIYPVGRLKIDIEKFFGSIANFITKFKKSASNLKGSGYTFLVYNKNKLFIINTSNEDSPYLYKMFPVICLDLWEHAYFLEYKVNKEEYINNFFKLVDFKKINRRYEKFLAKTNKTVQ